MTQSTIRVTNSGLLTTVQDLGRRGFQKYGVPVCGALDAVSMRIANILVGNPETLAGLEITAVAPSLVFDRDAVIAIVGADFAPVIDGVEARAWESVRVPAGAAVGFRPPADGVRAWLAVDGGIDVPPSWAAAPPTSKAVSADTKADRCAPATRSRSDARPVPPRSPPRVCPTASAASPLMGSRSI